MIVVQSESGLICYRSEQEDETGSIDSEPGTMTLGLAMRAHVLSATSPWRIRMPSRAPQVLLTLRNAVADDTLDDTAYLADIDRTPQHHSSAGTRWFSVAIRKMM